MTQQDLLMPALGLTMEEGTVATWHAAAGDRVELGADLLVVATDKAEVEIESPYEGVLADILVEAGATVPVGTVIARFTLDGAPTVATPTDGVTAAPAPVAATEPTTAVTSTPNSTASSTVNSTGPSSVRAGAKVRATPLARKIAAGAGVDLAAVAGSGPNGRIRRADVECHISTAGTSTTTIDTTNTNTASTNTAAASVTSTPATAGVAGERTPMTGLRKIIAERMHHSSTTTAPVTLTTRANAAGLLQLRSHLVDAVANPKCSYNDVIIACCAQAIREQPDIVLQIDGNDLVRPVGNGIGLAVQTDAGLIVPVVGDALSRSIVGIATERERVTNDALAGRIHPRDLEGGLFTVSNLGAEGIEAFSPIINLPQSAILGVGAIRDTFTFVDGVPTPAREISLSLTFDHRSIDGQPAAKFLRRIVELLEYPFDLRTGVLD